MNFYIQILAFWFCVFSWFTNKFCLFKVMILALVAVHGSHICALPFIFEVPLCAFGVLLVYLCFSLVWLTINLGSIKLFQSLVWNKHQMFEMKRTPAAYFKWLLFSFVIMSVEEYAVLWLLLQIIYGNYLKIFLV